MTTCECECSCVLRPVFDEFAEPICDDCQMGAHAEHVERLALERIAYGDECSTLDAATDRDTMRRIATDALVGSPSKKVTP